MNDLESRFDTGFVCFAHGWMNLCNEDMGYLQEHLVLNELQGQLQLDNSFRYWRLKRDQKIDFVYLQQRSQNPIAIECKLKADNFEIQNLRIFGECIQRVTILLLSQTLITVLKEDMMEFRSLLST
ncbi:MAG: DUF4143 domain-containing protein [Parachlamydia sp.]|nr:DUF4143 domain-containing protein [Parachlamydia sp.]